MKSKIAFWIITLFVTAALVYVYVTTVIQPVFTRNPLPKAIVRTSDEKKKTGKDDFVSPEDDAIPAIKEPHNTKDATNQLVELRRKEVLLRARLSLASEDSTYLVLDLIHNMATLELKGIPLHECRIVHTEISNSIQMYSVDAILNWLSAPFILKNADATIPKISFIEKIAPKDTLEANKMVTEPKEKKLEDVFIVMDFDRNLRLLISQSEKPDDEGLKIIAKLRQKYNKIEI